MSSDDLEKSMGGFRPASQRLLVVLKTRGAQTAAELGVLLGITGEAARQQLMKLATEGLVTATSEPRGVGRPAQFWLLTAEGNARFPDAHADLMVQLLRTIRTQWGEASLDQLIEARAVASLSGYLNALADSSDLSEKIARLAEIRSREGYMAEWRAEGEGYVLIENHCPICAAASTCQGFCRTELDTFQKVLGEGIVIERTEHIVGGDRRCVYRIARTGGTGL